MGRVGGILRIEGTLDNMTFYKTADGRLVRTKGGPTKEQVRTDPAFLALAVYAVGAVHVDRGLCGVEFGENARAGKLLRDAANPMSMRAKDGKLTSRLVGEMSKIKNLDLTSARGERTVAVGIGTPAGKAVLNGFNFNDRSHLSTVLHAPYVLVPATGEVAIADFVPKMKLTYPTYATHVSLSCGFLNVDFGTGIYDLTLSPELNLAIDMASTNVSLMPSGVPVGTGTKFYFLLIEYFQMVNGVEYPLNNGAFNALGILDVV